MGHTHKDSPDDHLAAHKRKTTHQALERMRTKPAWQQRQEAIELAERDRARKTPDPAPDDGEDDASTRRGLL